MKPLALYIHWPFCLSKCPYCDFNSHVRKNIDEQAWEKGLIFELHRYAKLLENWQQPRQLTSIFFGGGTPSLMQPKTVEKIIQTAIQLWPISERLEITLEANPNSIEVESFQALNQIGVNRISIGIQALNDKDLKGLGRQHSIQEGIKAIETACHTFKHVSFDLIYARPKQTIEQWQQELIYALSFQTEHLSLYQLTIEPGTAFATQYERGELILLSNDTSADLYELTQHIMEQQGLPAYEISNHAKKGFECQHNISYWCYQDYIGIGPGAHGRLTLRPNEKIATRQKKSPEAWLKSIEKESHGDAEIMNLTLEEQFREQLLMGLRLKQGIKLENLTIPLNQAIAENFIAEKKLNYLKEEGYLEISLDCLKATPAGQQRLQSLLTYLLPPLRTF